MGVEIPILKFPKIVLDKYFASIGLAIEYNSEIKEIFFSIAPIPSKSNIFKRFSKIFSEVRSELKRND